MDTLASALLYEGSLESSYLSASEAAVEARIRYYDMLARFAEQG